MAYSDAEQAEALVRLAVNKYDYEKTANDTGVSIRSLRNWAKNCPKKGVADLLERAIERLLMVIPSDMDGHDWSVALGILLDKWLLFQGQATARTENILTRLPQMKDGDIDAVLREAECILAEATGGGVVEGEHQPTLDVAPGPKADNS